MLGIRHLFIALFILGIPAFLIYYSLKERRNSKKIMAAHNPNYQEIEKQLDTTIIKIGRRAKSFTNALFIITILFYIIYLPIYMWQDVPPDAETPFVIGKVIGTVFFLIFCCTILFFLFSPIRNFYKRYLLYKNNSYSEQEFAIILKRTRIATVLLSIIGIPLSLGFVGLMLIPHYIFLSKVSKEIKNQ